MQKINLYLISIIVSLLLIGCGGKGSSSSSETTSENISGSAVDGYISGAVVCLDININGICDEDEPTTSTGTDGAFLFTNVEIDDELIVAIVSGGIDMATGKIFVGKIKNVIESESIKS